MYILIYISNLYNGSDAMKGDQDKFKKWVHKKLILLVFLAGK